MTKKLIFGDDNLGRLHCDNPSCGYDLDEALPFTEELIGFRCPMCGSDMLTEQDYRLASRMLSVINFINKWFGWLGREEPPPGTPVQRVKIAHGTINITEVKNGLQQDDH